MPASLPGLPPARLARRLVHGGLRFIERAARLTFLYMLQ
jgi:hypothetical protein